MRHQTTILIPTLLLSATTGAASGDEPFFTGLGSPPGYGPVTAISADGTVVVGGAGGAYRWTSGGGWEPLAAGPYPHERTYALAVSGDGQVTVGVSEWEPDCPWPEGCAWPGVSLLWEGGEFVELGSLHHYDDSSHATAVSANGRFVAGISGLKWYIDFWGGGGGWADAEAYLLDRESDLMIGLGFGEARAMSADGTVVVGTNGVTPVRWENGNIDTLGGIPGGEGWGEPNAINADGSIIVGMSSDGANCDKACRWTFNGTVWVAESLGFLPEECDGWSSGRATGVSADGTIVVGDHYWVPNNAFVWNATDGMQSLNEVLADLGLDVSGWSLDVVAGVSADGRTIAGYGSNPDEALEGWIAHLGNGSTPGDVDGDGSVTVLDLLALLSAWGACSNCAPGSCAADLNGDCTVNILDLLDLLSHWG
jgi:uncharacterized membrane protein